MAGFRYCKWCDGKGCMCCDGERAKWEKAESKRKAEHAARTPDQIRKNLATLFAIRDDDRSNQAAALAVAWSGGRHNIDMDAINAEIAKEEALLDAEYARQFPDGPVPIFVAKRGTSDISLMKAAFGIDALNRAFGPDGRGMEDIEEGAEKARATQALRDYAYSAP